MEHAPQWAQTAEHGIGLTWRIMILLSEGQCHLEQVWLPHPAVATEATYRSRFDAPLTFQADRLGLAFAARDLDLLISEQNRELHESPPPIWTVRYHAGEPPSPFKSARPSRPCWAPVPAATAR